MNKNPFENRDVALVFEAFPKVERRALLDIRDLIFELAKSTPQVGRLSEELRWGQPAYLTSETKSGSTIRLGVLKQGGFAVFTHCQTSIMSDFRQVVPDLDFDGNRAVRFQADAPVSMDQMAILIQNALTYHL